MRALLRIASLLIASTLGTLVVSGCEQIEQVEDRWRPMTPHEEYLQGLHDAGLAGSGLSQAWILEAAEAVRSPRDVELPFREATYVAADAPEAIGYRFRLERGQQIRIGLDVEADPSLQVFLDFFRLAADPADPPRPVATARTTPEGLVYEPDRAGDYLVRLQPELLQSGRMTLTLELNPALAFPVEGRDIRAILSFFGVARDGGRRSHEGVDVFAPRGTPVLASAAGRITRANVTNLGGKVVWLRDDVKRRSIYYAHLDSQTVTAGTRVEIGDTVGFVGNTGNARTTPPHLHYGVYYRGEGAIDPFPFLAPPRRRLAEVVADADRLGSWARVVNEGLRLRAQPESRADVVRELPQHTAVRLVGASGEWYRVRLPDGTAGYLSARLTEDLDAPVAERVAARAVPARSRPEESAPLVETLATGAALAVLANFGDYWMVRTPTGRPTWIRADAETADADG